MIESMLVGTPVVAFRCGSAPEVIEDGVTGFCVDDVAAMAAAIPRAAGLDRARCRARARERFSTARMVDDYLRVYDAAVQRGVRRGIRAPRTTVPGSDPVASAAPAVGYAAGGEGDPVV
jgi:hypothetical protein